MDNTSLHKTIPKEDGNRKKFKKRKRRRTNEKMKNIIKTIEKEIENLLDIKNEKNDFTTTDVKAILKEVITDEDIKEMLRQTLHFRGGTESAYEPKLTRAKIRELLKLRPELSFPILWPIPANKNANFVSECLSLINENYSENSSEDEEYKPDDEDSVDDLTTSSSFIPNSEDNINNSSGIACASSISQNSSHASTGLEEGNIGQRTRSKLPLTDTPLEVIEQAFVPPDITIDMYESECDNEDWLNFIKRFVQPLDLDDDADDDPEYNILADEETVDKEELRKDRGVEVPQQEVDDLIAELFRDCDPINSILEDTKFMEDFLSRNEAFATREVNQVEAIPISDPNQSSWSKEQPTVERDDIVCTSTPNLPVLLPSQRQLLDQQMRQHVQLTTMHFLQFHKHPVFNRYANTMKELIVSIKNLSGNNKNSVFFTLNLESALRLIREWEELCANKPEPKFNYFGRDSKTLQKKLENFHRDIMKVATKSDVFLYPLLLPHRLFNSILVTRKTELIDSEEWLLSVGLEEFIDYIKRNYKNKNEEDVLKEAVKLIVHYLLPCFTDQLLIKHIKKRRSDPKPNYIKQFYEKKKAPPLKHYVVPIASQPLFKQPLDLMPEMWATYIQNNYVFVRLKKLS